MQHASHTLSSCEAATTAVHQSASDHHVAQHPLFTLPPTRPPAVRQRSVKRWLTFIEPFVICNQRYGNGMYAPWRNNGDAGRYRQVNAHWEG